MNDYSSIDTFRELTDKLDGKSQNSKVEAINNNSTVQQFNTQHQTPNTSIGIDIEQISSLPKTNDFRNEGFYIDNFSEKEIAYCILQPNVYSSFAGLFAAKEAILKANNQYQNIKFRDIVITHNAQGKPEFNGVTISISHTEETAVAVAVIVADNTTIIKEVSANTTQNNTSLFLALLALTFAIIALAF